MMKPSINCFTIILFVGLIVSTACTHKPVENKVPVAKVNDKYLYLSDIQHIFPKTYSKQDSINLARSYIHTWIKTQLLVNQAELNLSPSQLDITQQLDAYRSSLLIFKYEEQMINQKIDTVVTDKEIQDYYNQNTQNFVLDDNLVKALYIKIPLTAPDKENAQKWYKSDAKEDISSLDSYCFNYAAKYDYFNDNWVGFSVIQGELPKEITNEDDFLNNNQYIEQQDDHFLYLVNIRDRMKKGTQAPLEFVKPKIMDIILNKRKIQFISNLETSIYNDAQDHSKFEIYNIDKK